MTASIDPGELYDHYVRWLREPVSREVYRSAGQQHAIQALRFARVFPDCTTICTLGLSPMVSGYEVVLAADRDVQKLESMLVRTLFGAVSAGIPLRPGISIGGLANIDAPWVTLTGKAAFYFMPPTPFPDGFGQATPDVQLLLAFPIAEVEHQLVKESGGDALESALEAADADPFTVMRPAVGPP